MSNTLSTQLDKFIIKDFEINKNDTLYDQIEKISMNHLLESSDNPSKILLICDLAVDKDELENESQPGDTYLFVCKGENGTLLQRLTGREEQKDVLLNAQLKHLPSDSKYYILHVEDKNKGVALPSTKEQIIEAINTIVEPFDRKPNRTNIYSVLEELISNKNKKLIDISSLKPNSRVFIDIDRYGSDSFIATTIVSNKGETPIVQRHLLNYLFVNSFDRQTVQIDVNNIVGSNIFVDKKNIEPDQFKKILKRSEDVIKNRDSEYEFKS